MPRYYPIRIQIGTLGIAAALVYLSYRGMNGQSVTWGLVVPCLIVYALLVSKWAAPEIPWREMLACCILVLLIHYVADWIDWPPGYLVADKIVEMVLILGFGASWVRRKYLPWCANR